jgi:spermidine synthase
MGFSCMIYEFALAQTLSLLLGQTAVRYPITIGLYTAALGFGSLCFNYIYKNTKVLILKLIKIEILITIISCSAFILLFLCDFIFKSEWLNTTLIFETIVMQSLTHLLVFIIGFLSGVELPLLMEMGEEYKAISSIRILAGDYFGTLLAAVFFPLIFLPNLHLFSIIVIATLLNLTSAVFLYIFYLKKENQKNKAYLFIWPALSMLLLIFFERFF